MERGRSYAGATSAQSCSAGAQQWESAVGGRVGGEYGGGGHEATVRTIV
jgi:hypothetical protein